MKTIIAAFAVILLTGCTDGRRATSVLIKQGFDDIRITGYRFFACSKDDFFHTGFEAKAPTGTAVSGTVCSGLFFKGNTIRWD